MFRIVYKFLLLIIISFILWICLIKILYRNNQCKHIHLPRRKINQSSIDRRLKLHHFTILGTHNSYHKESLFYRYEHSNLDEQLTYGIRQIELDIHLMSDNNVVYHLQIFDDRTNCYCLKNCLEKIFQWSKNHSDHYPTYLFIEIKQMFYEDLFTGLNGGVKCKHLQMIKDEILQVFTIESLILAEQIRGNQSSINFALKTQRQNELNQTFTYQNYGWPPVYRSLGKIIPIFIDDVHRIVEKLISTCEPLSNFFLIAQTNSDLHYASIISITNPLKDQHLMSENTKNGHLIRILLGYNGKQLLEKYNQGKKYGAHIISTDSVQCNNTELCQSIAEDFQRTSSVLCNRVLAPVFCNATQLNL